MLACHPSKNLNPCKSPSFSLAFPKVLSGRQIQICKIHIEQKHRIHGGVHVPLQTNMIPGSPSSDDSDCVGFNKLRRRKLSFRRRTEKGFPDNWCSVWIYYRRFLHLIFWNTLFTDDIYRQWSCFACPGLFLQMMPMLERSRRIRNPSGEAENKQLVTRTNSNRGGRSLAILSPPTPVVMRGRSLCTHAPPLPPRSWMWLRERAIPKQETRATPYQVTEWQKKMFLKAQIIEIIILEIFRI